LYDVKEKPQLELCAPSEIRILTANYCTRGAEPLKGSHRLGTGGFSKNLSMPLFIINGHRINLTSTYEWYTQKL
jgi:hypothetical protein